LNLGNRSNIKLTKNEKSFRFKILLVKDIRI
jgi:hypothetical protein